ncbi:MAG TPA: hypothetical protein PLG86_04965, partial [Bacteroidales bacterium]|nr:hypothetical protein [Bacteroidales bacterium]
MKINFPERLKCDSYIFGILTGVAIPALSFAVIYGIKYLIEQLFRINSNLPFASILLLSIIGNLLLIRYFLVNHKFEKSGRGIVLITAVLVVGYFVLEHFLILV